MINHIAVPAGVIAILASLLLPLPQSLLDFLLVVNLLLALILLMSALYISEPLKLSALPSILLLATLYRLALNVSTTRLILNFGEAGKVIEAFGEVVIQGNLVVGIVIFLIITVIQFIVIAKGAERVAEVAARFTLDALPGKQMSIDADVRAGLIDFEAARSKRQDLQTESRFYGALDGAMKFVKGDAIAGIIIIIVNILGGLFVGLTSQGLTLSDALSQYTLLTVGDGLVSQIPALLNALAAGIIVTRVSRGDGVSLANELPRQLGQVRSAKVAVAVIAVLLAFVPHMPALPFLVTAALVGLSSLMPSSNDEASSLRQSNFQPRTPAVLEIQLGEELGKSLYAMGTISPAIDELRQGIFNRTGLILSTPEFNLNRDLKHSIRFEVRGIKALEIDCSALGADAMSKLLQSLEELVMSRIPEFIDDILTRRTLDRFDREAPELVSAVIPGIISVTQLTDILRNLATEGLPIRNLDLILQAVAEVGVSARGERRILEEVRVALRRVISQRFCCADSRLKAFTISAVSDLALSLCEREGKPFNAQIIEHICERLTGLDNQTGVLLVSKAARRMLRELLVARAVLIPVLAFEEIADGVVIDKLARVDDLLSMEAEAQLLEDLAA